jgi:hypothetical protein
MVTVVARRPQVAVTGGAFGSNVGDKDGKNEQEKA